MLAAAGALFIVVLLGRLLLASLYAESVPYWDQWDAEGALLIKPWLEGQLQWSQLFAPHNEHRVVFSRLLSLLLFEANDGQWDNLVLVHANGLVYAAVAVIVYAQIAPGLPARLQRLALAASLCLLAWLPFGYTNALVGFQNQFFAMAGMAAAAVGVAACGRDRAWTAVLVVALCICSLFTMASGLLAAVAAGGVLLLRAWQRDLRPGIALAGTAALALVAVGGYLLIPHLAGHDALKADGAGAFFHVFALNLGWPHERGALGALMVWLPFLVAGAWVLVKRDLPRPLLAAFGLGAWVVLQCAAIAYSRGGEASIVGRYVDTLALGLVANFALALYLAHAGFAHAGPAHAGLRGTRGGLALAAAVPLLYAGLVFGWLAWQAPADLRRAAHRNMQSQLQTENVRRYVATGLPAQLDQPFMEVPYPHPSRLAMLLSDPTLRQVLPASVRLPLQPAATQARGFVQRDRLHTFAWTSCIGGDCTRAQGTWWADFPAPAFARVVVPQWTGPARSGLSVAVTAAGTPAPAAVAGPPTATGLLPVAPAPFRVTIGDASTDNWIAFGAPVEIGPLSAASRRLQAWVRASLHGAFPVVDLRRYAVLPVSGQGERTPLKLAAGDAVETRFPAPRTGAIEELTVVIGTYFNQANGDLVAEVCTTAACATGRADLARAVDNSPVTVALDRPLPLMHGGAVRVRFRSERATHPVALWAFVRKPDSPQLQPSALVDAELAQAKALRLGLGYQQ
jgi:hypothetical protein